jgi:hypothetical protein
MTNEKLALLIEGFAFEQGVSPSTVTKNAVDNGRIYKNLKTGGSCTLTIAGRIVSYIEECQQ